MSLSDRTLLHRLLLLRLLLLLPYPCPFIVSPHRCFQYRIWFCCCRVYTSSTFSFVKCFIINSASSFCYCVCCCCCVFGTSFMNEICLFVYTANIDFFFRFSVLRGCLFKGLGGTGNPCMSPSRAPHLFKTCACVWGTIYCFLFDITRFRGIFFC